MACYKSATFDGVRGSLLLELALDRARLKERFAAMLLDERAQRGHGDARRYPQPKMAAELGLSLRQYQRWENPADPSMPGTEEMLKVCEAFSRSPSELFGEVEPVETEPIDAEQLGRAIAATRREVREMGSHLLSEIGAIRQELERDRRARSRRAGGQQA